MSEFELIWESSRFNVFYYLSWVSPALVLIATVLVRRWWGVVAGVLLAFSVTFALVCLKVELKWDIRKDAAKSEREFEAIANRDSANLAFTPIDAFAWAFASTFACAIPAVLSLRIFKTQLRKPSNCGIAQSTVESPQRIDSRNPYEPPSS